MKVSIEIDLNPAEARELMGWQDMSQLQKQFVKLIGEQMQNGDPETIQSVMEPLISETQKNFAMFQKMMESFIPAGKTKK